MNLMFRQVPLHRDDVMYVEARTAFLLHQRGMALSTRTELARVPPPTPPPDLKELEEWNW